LILVHSSNKRMKGIERGGGKETEEGREKEREGQREEGE
jgi:hypothetical protein